MTNFRGPLGARTELWGVDGEQLSLSDTREPFGSSHDDQGHTVAVTLLAMATPQRPLGPTPQVQDLGGTPAFPMLLRGSGLAGGVANQCPKTHIYMGDCQDLICRAFRGEGCGTFFTPSL